jgi:hypothetical protein
LIGLITTAPICANQRNTFSPMSPAVSDFSLVESAEWMGIRLPHYFQVFLDRQVSFNS